MYKRKKRESDGSTTEYAVEDHAWRLYRELGGDVNALPDYFVSALAMSAQEHIAMMEAVQPFVDTAISKTVNIPADYPYDDFKDLYLQAWRARLKGLATYRPNTILGSVLETHVPAPTAEAPAPAPKAASAAPVDPMRTVIESRPQGGLSAVAEKLEYWTQEGHKTLYLIVSFLPVPTGVGDRTVDRAIEFFMPVGQDPARYRGEVLDRMKQLVRAAEGSGVTLVHENEKEIYGDTPARCLDILTQIDSPILRAAVWRRSMPVGAASRRASSSRRPAISSVARTPAP